MAWTEPKTDWVSANSVADPDLNEIGENLVVLKTHVDASTDVHGAVSAATASKIIIRDAAGRAKVVAPSAEEDIALKSNVTTEAGLRAAADTVLQGQITTLGTDYLPLAGGTMTGDAVGHTDTDYTTLRFRNIVLRTTVPAAGDLNNGDIAFVYEV